MRIIKPAKEMKVAGKNVIGLAESEPDFDTPDHINAAAIEAIKKGETHCTAVDGMARRPFYRTVERGFERETKTHIDCWADQRRKRRG